MLRSKKWIIATILIIGVLWIVFLKYNKIEITPIEIQRSFLDDLAWKLAACESSQVPDIKILDSNNEYSFGMLQFQQKTFDYFGEKCGLDHNDIYSYEQQRDIFKCMYQMGIVKTHWKICSNKLNIQ